MNVSLLTHYDKSIFGVDGVVCVSEKYDGWRMYYKKGKFYTRRDNEIKLPKKFYRDLAQYDYEFDGELWLGYGTTSSDITSVTDYKNAKYMIFDILSLDTKFKNRNAILNLVVKETDNIKIVKQYTCKTEKQMELVYNSVLKRGGEGVVIRPPSHIYKHGQRDKIFQKKKPLDTMEAIVVGYYNTNKIKIKDYVSSLVVESVKDKCRFKVSIKSTSPPKIGSVVTVSYSQRTVSGLPKHPVFVGVRGNADLPEEAIQALTKKKNYVFTPLVVDLEHPQCDGVITASECKTSPPRPISMGRHIYYDNEKGIKHKVSCDRAGKTAYCTCEAWKYQRLPAVYRTCKHCIMVYGYKPEVPWEVLERMKEREANRT